MRGRPLEVIHASAIERSVASSVRLNGRAGWVVVMVAIAFVAQYIVGGTLWVEAHLPLRLTRWIALGLLAALATGLGSLFWGYPFLTTHTAHLTLPLLGELHVASALFFDAGVFATVVGSTLLILTALAHQSVRSHRQAPESTVTASTGPREVG